MQSAPGNMLLPNEQKRVQGEDFHGGYVSTKSSGSLATQLHSTFFGYMFALQQAQQGNNQNKPDIWRRRPK